MHCKNVCTSALFYLIYLHLSSKTTFSQKHFLKFTNQHAKEIVCCWWSSVESNRKIIFIFDLFNSKEGIYSPCFWPLCCYFFNNGKEKNKLLKPPTVMKHQDHTDFMNNRFPLMCFEKIWLLPFLYYFIWQTQKR